MVRARLLVTGRVQGVWYRQSMQDLARRLHLAGWVANRPDGTVEAEVEGPRDAVDRVIAWAHEGPPAARVASVSVEWREPQGEHGAFGIRR